MTELAFGSRVCLATAMGLAVGWKLSHRYRFAAAFEDLAPRRVNAAGSWAVWPVSAVESATVFLLVLGQYLAPLSWVGPAVALATIGLFTLALGLAPAPFECGCWAGAPANDPVGKLHLVIRNLILLALALAILLLGHGYVAPLSAVATVPMGAVAALMIIELPSILTVVRGGGRQFGPSPAHQGRP